MPSKPRLRPLDFQPVTHLNQQMWLLRDPLQLSQQQLLIPSTLAPLLVLCDGTRTPQEIHRHFCEQAGVTFPLQITADALAQLDELFLLQNERYRQARQQQLEEYRAQPFRPPALANLTYPADTRELLQTFQRYRSSNGHVATQPAPPPAPWRGRGIVSPHIDYQRGGPVYARLWQQATPAVLDADLVIILGTDHNGRAGSITLTHQAYATPFGVLPADPALVGRLAEAIGAEAAFADEIHHRQEHSIELSAVWLHSVYYQAGANPPPMLPILVGSFYHFLGNDSHPARDPQIERLLETLWRETNGRRLLVVGSVDLAHVGPNFGDEFVMDDHRRAEIRQMDQRLIDSILQGNADAFYDRIAAVDDRNRICGFAPLYLMLRLLGPTSGVQIAYDHCPADPQDHSLVSICGLLLQ